MIIQQALAMEARTARDVLSQITSLRQHPKSELLLKIVTGGADLSSLVTDAVQEKLHAKLRRAGRGKGRR